MVKATATMEYITRFRYARSVEPLFRRATHRRVEDTVILVQFNPQKLPRAVWWTEWADYRESDTSVLRQETTKLDPDHAVHRHLELVERAVVGFMWEF